MTAPGSFRVDSRRRRGGRALRRFIATYEYTRIVGGEPREFTHEAVIEALNEESANELAVRHFETLDRQTGLGWSRVLSRCEVAAVSPRDATAD